MLISYLAIRVIFDLELSINLMYAVMRVRLTTHLAIKKQLIGAMMQCMHAHGRVRASDGAAYIHT